MNSKTNRNAIMRYSNTSCNNDKYVTNPIVRHAECNAFKLFTKNLSYFKTKYQHKHFDKCNTPYDITMDNYGNAYIKWNNIHDGVLSDNEIKTLEKIVLIACDIMSDKGLKLTVSSVREYLLNTYPNMYFNGVDFVGLVKTYKKIHDIKHKSDKECLIFRPKKPTISVGAKKLGTVVGK